MKNVARPGILACLVASMSSCAGTGSDGATDGATEGADTSSSQTAGSGSSAGSESSTGSEATSGGTTSTGSTSTSSTSSTSGAEGTETSDTGTGGSDTGEPGCPFVDLVPRPCTGEDDCEVEDVCVRGVCIAYCNEEAAVYEDGLGPSLVPIANLCTRGNMRDAAVIDDGDCPRVWAYDANPYREGDEILHVSFSAIELDPGRGQAWPALWMAELEPEAGILAPFPARFFELYDVEALAAFGLANDVDPGGKVAAIDWQTGEVGELPTFDLRDADWLDATTLLVAAAEVDGAMGADVWAVDFSDLAAPVATPVLTGVGRWNLDVLPMADLLFTTDVQGDFLYATPLDEVRAVIAGGPVADPSGTPTIQAIAIDVDPTFWMLDEGRMALYADEMFVDLAVRDVTIDGGGMVALGDPTPLVSGNELFAVTAIDEERVIVDHYSGMLVARWQ